MFSTAVSYAVLSHLMSEHAGWLPAFAGTRAKIVVQSKQYEYATTIGNPPGYQALLVRLPQTGTVVLSGCEIQQMYYSVPLRGYAPGVLHSFTWFASGEFASLKRVRDLTAAKSGQIFCGHDA